MTKAEFLRQFHHARTVWQEQDYPLRVKGRPAAVLIPLIDYGDSLSVLLTERAHHLKHHPGQISFPGGGVESQDAGVIDAALREAEEETGLYPTPLNLAAIIHITGEPAVLLFVFSTKMNWCSPSPHG